MAYQPTTRNEQLRAARARGTHTDAEFMALCREFDFRCVCCGCTPIGRPTRDHVVPISLGGSDSISNIQPLCRECNTSKHTDCTDWREYRRVHGWADAEFDA